MANRLKEDEKNERIIRGLLKLPENRRCINCNSLGPQYVCINFWTFVCTACSGIHREFTHRVKSISMAKFTSQEVSALQEGGNQRAKEIYFKEWDPQRQSFPDSSNVERLRDFIKHVYVDRRYTGDRSYDKPPRVKMGDKEEFYENRSQGGSRSPPYEDTYERRYSDRSSPGGRSPGYEQDNRQYGDYRRSPARAEVVNDWRRDDRFGNGRKFEDRRDGESKVEGRSPERLQDMGSSSPPVVRPVREILGENVVPLRISEPPKANGGRTSETSAQTQRTASSSSLGFTNGNPPEVKLESTVSLIDFDTDPEPPPAAGVAKTQQTTAAQTFVQPTISANDNNWASFDFPPDPKVSHPPSNVNTLDSVLSELSVPATVPGHTSGVPSGPGISMAASMGNLTVLPDPAVAPVGHTPMLPSNVGALAVSPGSSFSTFPPGGALASNPAVAPAPPTSAGHFLVKATDQGQWPSVEHQQRSFFPAAGNPSATQQFTPPLDGSASNQPWNTSLPPNVHGFLSTPAAQAVSIPVKEVTSGGAQPSSMEVKPTGRKELPEDLFATTYQFFPASVPGWHTGPPRGMGFSMQYNAAAVPLQSQPLPNFPQPSKSTNPFDLSSEPPQNQTFPSMLPLQSALPSVPSSSGLLRTSSLGTPSPAWMPAQSLVYPGMPSQAPFHPSAVPPRYMGPPVASNILPSSHQLGSIGNEGPPFGFVNTDQQLAGRFSASVARHPFSSAGGNPFG